MIKEAMLLAEIAIMAAYVIKLYISGTSASERVELMPSAEAEEETPAGEAINSVQPPRPRKPETTPKPMHPDTASKRFFGLDRRFFEGKTEADEYLKSRKNLMAQLQAGLHETREAETDEVGEDDLEILRLAGEKKSVMEIAVRLIKDPEEVSRKIEEFTREGYLEKEVNLTGQRAKTLGKRENMNVVREEASEPNQMKEAALFLLTGVMFLTTGVLLLAKIYIYLEPWILTFAIGVFLFIITGEYISRTRRIKT